MGKEPLLYGFTCSCGHETRYPAYVFAHYNDVLTTKCEGCSRGAKIFRGLAWPQRRRKSDTNHYFTAITEEKK